MEAASENQRRRNRRSSWTEYAAGSEINHFTKFCREHLIQSEDRWEGMPLILFYILFLGKLFELF